MSYWFMKQKNGFTLIELLAVIIILGILMIIAVPNVTTYILNSRKSVYISSAKQYISEAQMKVNSLEFKFFDTDTTYYVHIANLNLEKGGKSPFGEWEDAYVVVTYDVNSYDYYWVSVDDAGNKIDVTLNDDLNVDDIYNDEDKTVNNRMPIGVRSKVYIIDKDGNSTESTQRVILSKEEAKSCYSYMVDGNDNITITYYQKSCGNEVVIPGIIDGHLVTSIYQYAFNNMGLVSVIIPDTVQSIGIRAFSSNSISKVVLPDGLKTIEEEAFLSNQISKISFPEGLTTLGRGSFRKNKISDFTLPSSLSLLGSCAFCENPIPNPSFLYAKTNGATDYSTIIGYIGDLSEFTNKRFIIPASVNGIDLKTIGDSAFRSMTLSNWEVVIPDSVTSIGARAFDTAGIAKVNLPDGLKTIGNSAFYNNRLSVIEIPSSVTSIGTVAFNRNFVTNNEQMWIYKRTASGIDYSTIIGYAGKNRNNIVIPENKNGVSLKTIYDGAFRFLNLTGGIRIPSTITSIQNNSFALNNLTYVDNGDGNISSGPYVYKRKSDASIDYTSLINYAGAGTNIVLPNNIKRLENYAFYYSSVKNVTLPEGLTYIGNYAFYVCKLEGTVVIPSTVTTIGTGAFYKRISWTSMNGNLNTIVNKTGRSFNWKTITNSASNATFVTGTVENWYGDIEIIN